jgi:AcrR family transcriptional regulator
MEKTENTEELVLRAAKEVFVEKGFEGSTMQEIANRAGVNKALVHYYFRNKEKLFEAVFTEMFSKIIPPLVALLESNLPIEEKIREFVSQYIDSINRNPLLPLFIIRELNRNPDRLVDIIKESGIAPKVVIVQMVNAVDDGNIRPFSPIHMVINILSLCVFPFAAKPLLKGVFFDGDEEDYQRFIEERKSTVSQFIINAIRKP